MRVITAILISIVYLSACSKEVQNNRALEGEWKPVSFSLFDYTLLKSTPECTGTIQFERDGKKSKKGTYDFNLLFDYKGTPLNLIEKGIYHIENKNSIKLLSSEGEETIVTLVYKTKEDLVLDFPNKNDLGYYIVLKK
jgi:hypothetical protein